MAVRSKNNNVLYDQVGNTLVRKTMANFFGASTDSKPTTNIVNGSSFMEVDTGKYYLFNEGSSTWVETELGGGGGTLVASENNGVVTLAVE